MLTASKRALCSAFAAAALAGAVATSITLAGMLPAQGNWNYSQDIGSLRSGRAVFQANLTVGPGQATLAGVQATVIGRSKCRKGGRNRSGSVAFSEANGSQPILVKQDGSFSARFRADDLVGRGHGTVRIKGVFNGTVVTGTLTAHMHDSIYGDCKGTGRFKDRGRPGLV